METNEVKENVKSMDSLVLDNTNNFIWLYNTIKMASTTQCIRSIYDNIERDIDKQNLIIGLAYIVEKNKSITSLDIRADMADIINDVSDKLEWGIDFKQRQDSDTQKVYFWGFAVVYPFIKISDTGSSCLIFSEYITDIISTHGDKYPNLDKSIHDVIIDKVNNIDKYLINTKLDGFTNDEEPCQSDKNESYDCGIEQEIKEDNADTNVVDNSNSINSSTITTSLDKPDFTKINEVVMNNVNRYIWLCNSIRMADTIQDVQNIYIKIEDNEDNQNLVTELAYIIDDNKEIISTDAELAIAEIIDEIYNALEYNASFLQSQGVDTDKSYTWAFPIVYPFITLSDNNMLHSLFSEYIKGVINKYFNKYPGMNRCMECNLINMIDSIADYIINTTEDKLITSDEQYAFSRNNSIININFRIVNIYY